MNSDNYHLTKRNNAGLIHAFGGRPFELLDILAVAEDERFAGSGWTEKKIHELFPDAVAFLILNHEHKDIHVDMWLNAEQLNMNALEFEERVAKVAINNLEGAAYPERWERFIAAVKDYAALVASSG